MRTIDEGIRFSLGPVDGAFGGGYFAPNNLLGAGSLRPSNAAGPDP